ncbi:hypothetical protein ABZ636_12220 [Streptomyces sp. NPDC007251]|uniref:hypothetical protein n=1 Tax=unclassified Streptomyces TaxID=2593676 RepID=UPI0033D4B060
MVAFLRSATIVDQDRITVRDAATRRTAWRDITAIGIEENLIPNAVGGRAKTLESIGISTREGRRMCSPTSRAAARCRCTMSDLETTSTFVPLTQLMSTVSAKAPGQHDKRDTDRKSPGYQE